MQNNKGNVLFLILIAVVLFAALSYAVTQSSRGTGKINELGLIDSATVFSSNASIETAINRLKILGCSDTELSFWHDSNGDGTEDGSDSYYNASAPSSKKCHIYDASGGGVTYQTPSSIYGAPQSGASMGYRITGSLGYSNTLSADPDLSIQTNNVNEDFCRQVNVANGYGNTLTPTGTGGACYAGAFTGTYTNAPCSDNQVSGNEFCTTQYGDYVYYKLLISR